METVREINMPKTDCKWFRGQVPCAPHKKHGYACDDCVQYEPLQGRILIIKLGAAGDVIRTTPLLRKIRQLRPQDEVCWVTRYPELVPRSWVDRVLNFSLENVLWLQLQRFSWMINLDKDDEAIALAESIEAERRSGFGMGEYGKCSPIGNAGEHHKWLTGLWDDVNRNNTRSYQQEIFDICGFEFDGEEYIVQRPGVCSWPEIASDRTVIGLNTGCGSRWKTRLWQDDYWIALARALQKTGYQVLLLGGPQEDERNRKIAGEAGVLYPGFYDLPAFIDLVDRCDLVVTQVTMAMHVALGLGKQVLLLNNIFNRHEFDLYGRGSIMQPNLSCLGCFKQSFDEHCPVSNCMDLITPPTVLTEVKRLLVEAGRGEGVTR